MITGNEPAMPVTATEQTFHNQDPLPGQPGLTIRQHFAAMAMQGMIGFWQDGYDHSLRVAEMSVRQADALIAELNKKPTP